jgi:hypothetical protein
MTRRLLLILVLVCFPVSIFAQLDIDGKTEAIPSKKPADKYSQPFTILYSATNEIPFGLKFQYCKSFGAYASFKSDFDLTMNHYFITAGFAKSLGKAVDFNLGGGLDLGYFEDGWDYPNGTYRNTPCLLLEGGFIFKIRSLAIDLGIGVAPEEYTEYNSGYEESISTVFVNFGLGFNF